MTLSPTRRYVCRLFFRWVSTGGALFFWGSILFKRSFPFDKVYLVRCLFSRPALAFSFSFPLPSPMDPEPLIRVFANHGLKHSIKEFRIRLHILLHVPCANQLKGLLDQQTMATISVADHKYG